MNRFLAGLRDLMAAAGIGAIVFLLVWAVAPPLPTWLF